MSIESLNVFCKWAPGFCHVGECNFVVLTLEKGLRIQINNTYHILDQGKFNEEKIKLGQEELKVKRGMF